MPSPNLSAKNIEIKFEGKKFTCKIQTIKNFLSISLNNPLKYIGYIHISKIQNQIGAFNDYNIDEIFEEINLLDNDYFSLMKEQKDIYLKLNLMYSEKKNI